MKVIRLERCDSTNNYLKTHLEDLKDRLPVLVTAALQTGGRGRRGRAWVSPRGKGLYSSFGFSMAGGKNLNFLPLLSGISVIETLAKVTGLEFGLKWPNDILYKDKKIAGILIENIIFDTKSFCIAGIGINLHHTAEDFPGKLADKAVSLKMVTGLDYSAAEMNSLLSFVFFRWLEKLKTNGKEDIIQTANRFSGHLKDGVINFHRPSDNSIAEGIFKGINHDGGLVLHDREGISTVYYSGEII